MVSNKRISYVLEFALSALVGGAPIRRVPGNTVQCNMVPLGVSVRMIMCSRRPGSFESSWSYASAVARNKHEVLWEPQQESQSTGSPKYLSELELSNPSHLYPHLVLLAAKMRSVVEDAVGDFLRFERRRLYTIHCPSPCGNASTVTSPHEYVSVLQKLRSCNLGRDAKKVYLVFVELLKRPLHPTQAGMEWDLSDHAMKGIAGESASRSNVCS